MKATAERNTLAAALKAALPAAGGGHLPILNGVRLDVVAGMLDVTATNLDLTIQITVDDVEGYPGTAIVPAHVLSRIVAAMPDGEVELATDDTGADLAVNGGEARAVLRTLEVGDWPSSLGDVSDGEQHELTPDQLADVARVLPYASTDGARPILCAVLFSDGRVAASDSYRLAEANIGGTLDMLVPATTIGSVLRQAGDSGVTVAVGSRHVAFRCGRTTWVTRQTEGDYPKYGSLIPADPPHSLTMSTARLAEAVARVSSLDSDMKGNALTIGAADGTATVQRRADAGVLTDTLPCDGDFERIGFNPAYLAQLLKLAETDDVTFGIKTALKPVVVRTERLTQLLMPVRVT